MASPTYSPPAMLNLTGPSDQGIAAAAVAVVVIGVLLIWLAIDLTP